MNNGMFNEIEDKTIFVVDEEGNEIEMEVAFTMKSEISQRHIVCYFNPDDEEGQVFASFYDDENNLSPIEDEAEWEHVEEVFNAYLADFELADEDEETVH